MINLPGNMNAIVCHGPKDYRLERVARPTPNEDEIIIKVESCGICGSDLKVYDGANMYWGGNNPWLKAPVIPGHEFYGTVVEVGRNAALKNDLKVGDKITTDQIRPCNECRFCLSGKYWMCQVHNMYGFQKDIAEGAMAEYMKLGKESRIYKIPDKLSDADASLIEPMACAVHAVQRAKIEFEDIVVLAGAGTLGLCMVQFIKLKTPKKIIVIDLNDKKLELAKKLGADIVLNPLKTDVVEEVKNMTENYGCDVYIEATGSPKGVIQGLEMIRKLGRFVEFSVFGEETTTDWSVIGDKKELDIIGSHLGPYTYPIVIDLFKRNKITSNGIVTHKFNISEFHKALDIARTDEAIKVLVKP